MQGRLPRYIEFKTTFDRTNTYMDEHIDEWLMVLSDMGRGELWQGWRNAKGEEKVYRVLPDREALKYLIDRHLYRTTTDTDLSLTAAKIVTEEAKIALIKAQTEAQEAQAAYTREQTQAFQRSVITPEMAERLIRSTMQFCIGLLQNLSDDDWANCVHYEKRQGMLLRIAQKMTQKAEEDIETLDENFTVEVEFENERA
jgi:hypothetical protein